MSHLYLWQKKASSFFCRSSTIKEANYLLYHIVCCIAAFCRLRLRRFTTHKGGGEVLQGDSADPHGQKYWQSKRYCETILRIFTRYCKTIFTSKDKQRSTRKNILESWCKREIWSIKNILSRQSWDQNKKHFWTKMFDHKVARWWE